MQNLTHTLKTPQKRVCSKQEGRPPPSLMGGVGVSVYFFLCMCTETWNPGDYREPRAPQIQVSFSMTIEAHSILNQTPHLWFLTHGAAVTISLQCTTKHDNQTLHWLQMDYECTIKIKINHISNLLYSHMNHCLLMYGNYLSKENLAWFNGGGGDLELCIYIFLQTLVCSKYFNLIFNNF